MGEHVPKFDVVRASDIDLTLVKTEERAECYSSDSESDSDDFLADIVHDYDVGEDLHKR